MVLPTSLELELAAQRAAERAGAARSRIRRPGQVLPRRPRPLVANTARVPARDAKRAAAAGC